MENRVWNRVLAGPGESGEDLRPLMLAALELTTEYASLLRREGGKQRGALQRLYDQGRVNLNCLKGIQTLRFGSVPRLSAMPATGGGLQKTLEKCYHRTRRAMQEYTARSAEPEFGAVFAVMAERERNNAALIAELLGMTEKGNP